MIYLLFISMKFIGDDLPLVTIVVRSVDVTHRPYVGGP